MVHSTKESVIGTLILQQSLFAIIDLIFPCGRWVALAIDYPSSLFVGCSWLFKSMSLSLIFSQIVNDEVAVSVNCFGIFSFINRGALSLGPD